MSHFLTMCSQVVPYGLSFCKHIHIIIIESCVCYVVLTSVFVLNIHATAAPPTTTTPTTIQPIIVALTELPAVCAVSDQIFLAPHNVPYI